jgi:hypothetical protein
MVRAAINRRGGQRYIPMVAPHAVELTEKVKLSGATVSRFRLLYSPENAEFTSNKLYGEPITPLPVAKRWIYNFTEVSSEQFVRTGFCE